MPQEYIVYCDESIKRGSRFSNFYGGALVGSDAVDLVRDTLRAKKRQLHLGSEIKWQKVTAAYLNKYIELLNVFFDFVADGTVKVRLMFTDNHSVNPRFDTYQAERTYFLLYYQFIKHAFGLRYIGSRGSPTNLRIYLDLLPDERSKAEEFKSYLLRLQMNPALARANIQIRREDIVEVDSQDHEILQCLDVVMGSMQFRLNRLHLVKPVGSRVRGMRTRAKHDLYNHINRRIREIMPNFNVGTSTGLRGEGYSARWTHPYRHWIFVPYGSRNTQR